MRTVLLVILLGMAGMCYGSQEGRENTAAVLLLAADWLQTRQMASQPVYAWVETAPGVYVTTGEQWSEMNPILGRHPSVGQVDTYFLGSLVVYVAAQKLLPERWATFHRRATIAVEVTCVVRNLTLGYTF